MTALVIRLEVHNGGDPDVLELDVVPAPTVGHWWVKIGGGVIDEFSMASPLKHGGLALASRAIEGFATKVAGMGWDSRWSLAGEYGRPVDA